MCISWLSGRKFLAFASGLMVGISMLIRPIGILIGVFFAIIFLFNKENGRIMLPRYWLKPVLVFYLGITISFIAFPLRNYITLGDFYDGKALLMGHILILLIKTLFIMETHIMMILKTVA
jgi:hypothetical protein